MFIIEMTMYESNYIAKNTESTKVLDMRTFDINHQLSLFVYFYEEYIHLKLRRYQDEETTIQDWNTLKSFGFIYPDIDLVNTTDIFIDQEDNQLHAKIPLTIFKRSDYL